MLVDPQVRTAVLTRKFPDTLVVTLQERSPVVRLRVADRSGQPRDYLVARDGVVFPGVNYAPELVAALPWLDGVTLAPLARGGFAPVAGLETVADLLETAQINVPNLRRTWRVIGMERFASYGEILVRTEQVKEITFGLRDDFLTQVALLDAVLAGRLETQSAPANLLRLSLPLPAAAAPQGLVGHALLLRCGDLEGEHPQLRTCRQRLQRLRQELRKMALLQTRLQQRLRTQEAERLWMQTVRRTRTDNSR